MSLHVVSYKYIYITYLFVVIFLPLTIFVEVDTDLKLPIPLPPNDVEENEVRPPCPSEPNEVKPIGKEGIWLKNVFLHDHGIQVYHSLRLHPSFRMPLGGCINTVSVTKWH